MEGSVLHSEPSLSDCCRCLSRRIRHWRHMCICGCFHYVCTAAGLMSAEIQAETRALQRAGLLDTLSYQEALEHSVLAALICRIRLRLHACINHCFPYVCTAAGLMSA
jgi:hypothetical protein